MKNYFKCFKKYNYKKMINEKNFKRNNVRLLIYTTQSIHIITYITLIKHSKINLVLLSVYRASQSIHEITFNSDKHCYIKLLLTPLFKQKKI